VVREDPVGMAAVPEHVLQSVLAAGGVRRSGGHGRDGCPLVGGREEMVNRWKGDF
jgi:hypothetical protein